MLQIAAQFARQLMNLSEIGRSVGLDHKTAAHYVRVLEQLYLVQRVQSWFRNELSRLVKTPKRYGPDGWMTAVWRFAGIGQFQSVTLATVEQTFVPRR